MPSSRDAFKQGKTVEAAPEAVKRGPGAGGLGGRGYGDGCLGALPWPSGIVLGVFFGAARRTG